MATMTLKEGDKVRYAGEQALINGKSGTFCYLQDHDFYDGSSRGLVPGFIDANGEGFFVELHELELV